MRISGSCMEWFLAIDAGAAVFILTLWYFWFARYNRRRALAVLHWVQSACAGKGRVLKVRWHGTSRLLAELRFPPHMFDHARVVVRLLPRPVPTNWVWSRWRKQKETLSFEADLDSAPRFQLDVHNHRWSGHNSGSLSSRNWLVTRPGPIVLTSRSKWGQELSPGKLQPGQLIREGNYQQQYPQNHKADDAVASLELPYVVDEDLEDRDGDQHQGLPAHKRGALPETHKHQQGSVIHPQG